MIDLNCQGRQLAFDQWRIVHLAEFGIYTFGGRGGAPPTPGLNFLDNFFFVNISIIFPPTPAPERKEPKPPKTPKSKRKAEQRAEQNRDEPDPSKPKVFKLSQNNNNNT